MTSLKTFVAASFAILSFLIHLFCLSPAYAAENHKQCKQCGMDLAGYPQSRMVIEYSDGTAVDVCSIHCAAVEMKQNKDRQIKSIMVADYATKKLTDAKSATWVIGGNKEGVMTGVPKWAFADRSQAQEFVKENGGRVTSFDEAMKAADEEAESGAGMARDHSHMGHDMGHMNMDPGSQMLFNPAFSDHIYHTHPAGMWMVNYSFMHMDMRGLRDGSSNVDQNNVGFMRGKPYNYMMIPTSMTMDMHMVMAMYGVTDRLTVMAMANYLSYKMKMLMDMGPMMHKPVSPEPPMTTSGFGDTEIRGMYKLSKYFVGSLGISLPTGSTEEEFGTMGRTYRAPYDMQLGSGTYDLKPAITYNGVSDDGKWNWGGQAQYTWHTARSDNDWSFGDNFKLTSWLQRAFGPSTTWLRLAYNDTGRIRGSDPEIQKLLDPNPMKGAPMPDADPKNYGGQRLDGLIGISYQKGPFSFGVEGGIPFYQYLNGLQLKTKWLLNAGLQVMF